MVVSVASPFRGRFLLFVAPLSAVVVVVLGVLAGGDRPFRSARVYSGPTEGAATLSLRVEVGERDRVAEAPVPGASFDVLVLEGGQRLAKARAKTDELGMAEVSLDLPRAVRSAFELWVEPASGVEPPLARGLVLGSAQAFRAAPRRGGFQSGGSSGAIELAVAPAHGVLVTAQGALDDELVLRAQSAGRPVASATITVKLEGGEPSAASVQTDGSGLARLRVQPRDASLRVGLTARAEDVGEGSLTVRFDVVQGAIRATRWGDVLRLESGGAANLAFLGFFDENRRYLGLHVPLTPAADGRLFAELPWPSRAPASPSWVVASSQADLSSPSAVGWPIASPEPAPRTFDARELLLLDGSAAGRKREDSRARRVRRVTAGYAVAALLVTLLLFLKRLQQSERDIQRHLSRSGLDDAAPTIAPPRGARTLLAVACIALGFLVVALLALLKD
jgi:hypothetical protein